MGSVELVYFQRRCIQSPRIMHSQTLRKRVGRAGGKDKRSLEFPV